MQVAGPGAALRRVYVGAARGARTAAEASGLLGHLDRRYDAAPRSVRGHVRTLFAIHDVEDLVRLDTPWWTYGAVAAVERHLADVPGGARVFEYGSGASTVWLARRSREVHSVEHHAGFAGVMRRVLAEAGVAGTVDLREVPAEATGAPVTRSGRRGEDDVDYTRYVRSIEEVGGLFDLVVVDGRARVASMLAALPHLAPGGLVVLDDAQRPRYRAATAPDAVPGVAVRHVWGWVPSLPYPRDTALVRRVEARA